MELKGKKINFLGDSITEGWGTSHPTNVYLEIIGREEGAMVRNYGIGGTRYAKQKLPSADPVIDREFYSRVDCMDPDADIIVVFGGTNDFGHGNAEMGTPDDRTSDTFWGAAHVLFQKLLQRYPAAQIVVLTPLHRTGENNRRGDGRKDHDMGTLREYVEIIRTVAEYYSLPVLDLFRISGLQPEVSVIREKYVPDGLHPNDAGHRLLADRLIAFLKAL